MNQHPRIRVLLADDHTMFRDGLKQVLAGAAGMDVVAEASTAGEVVECVQRAECDIVVLDISMPGRGGIDVLKQLKQMNPRLPVLILSMHPEDQYAYRAIKAGASGYVTKNKAATELVEAIRRVASGRKYIDPEAAELLAADFDRDPDLPLHRRLADREYQIMCLIASGKTVKQISEELSISASSVSTMRSRILKKFKMKSNAEITHYAIKHDLVS